MTNVYLPELGEGIEKATVSFWYFQEGQEVKEGEDLVEVSTDKATFNVPAPVSGLLAEVVIAEGDTANSGEPLAIIDESTDSDEEEDEKSV